MVRNFYMYIKNRLVKKYRVELIDDVTLSQSRQFSVKPITIILLMGAILISIVGGTIAFFVFTPAMHQLIPGYKNTEEFAAERAELEAKLATMEEQVDRWITYAGSFKKLAGVEDDKMPDISEDRMDSLRQITESKLTEYEKEEAIKRMMAQDQPETEPQPVKEQINNHPVPKDSVRVVYVQAPNSTTGIRVSNNSGRNTILNLFLPLKGEVRKGFDEPDGHYGVDIVADENTLIHSMADGIVFMSEYSDKNGWVIGVASLDNVITFYKHNSRLLKDIGTHVFAGEPIAVIGNTGENTTGPHLHLELWYKGRPIDPQNYVSFNK